MRLLILALSSLILWSCSDKLSFEPDEPNPFPLYGPGYVSMEVGESAYYNSLSTYIDLLSIDGESYLSASLRFEYCNSNSITYAQLDIGEEICIGDNGRFIVYIKLMDASAADSSIGLQFSEVANTAVPRKINK
ncbi:MAG TPA: hypothetical protein VHP30_13975 [Ignavibacteriales bacterium]|nr:hypothetical protein [Ignavibacteriales bacterium]